MSDVAEPAPAAPEGLVRTTPTEAILADMWRDLLGRSAAGTGENFFEAGGTSVMAIRFLQRVEKRFGPDVLTPEQLYEDPRLGALAKAVDVSLADG
ncbi:phosphopantetheine-binding protein [Streptomyces sp. NPDC059788]|uniref:phosphopantetheine-binding protein n=1 Tax=Streptomyces sp. NPDC059788 TaxID=3346948 RepID=UPI0036461744